MTQLETNLLQLKLGYEMRFGDDPPYPWEDGTTECARENAERWLEAAPETINTPIIPEEVDQFLANYITHI